jgi:hypothetical protein
MQIHLLRMHLVYLLTVINDIFYFIQESSLYNYADDNTLSYEDHNLDQLITVLERDSE